MPALAARWTRSCDRAQPGAVVVIEDNAHGLFGKYRGAGRSARSGHARRRASTRPRTSPAAKAGRFSSTIPRTIERAEIIREKGTNRSRFFRGQVDKYTWVDMGSSYLPSDMLAAFLSAQLEERERIQANGAGSGRGMRRSSLHGPPRRG